MAKQKRLIPSSSSLSNFPPRSLPHTCLLQNPVPASELTPDMLGCGNKGGAPGTLADAAQQPGERRRSGRRLQMEM